MLLGGDIAEATDVCEYLERIDDRLQTEVYFVLGNHDYYYGWIEPVREQVRQIVCRTPAAALSCRRAGHSAWHAASDWSATTAGPTPGWATTRNRSSRCTIST